jgi:hypothetical protein
MWKAINEIFQRWEWRLSLYQILSGGGILSTALITGWIASAQDWVNQYGALGWWIAALTGALAATLICVGIASLRYFMARASAVRTWSERVTDINPLDSQFNRRRIHLQSIVDPIGSRIIGKQFVNCELVGPANIFISPNSRLMGATFIQCDVVIAKDGAFAYNVIALENSEILNCTLWRCALFVTSDAVPHFQRMGAKFITLTGVPEIDSQSPPSIEQEKPQ